MNLLIGIVGSLIAVCAVIFAYVSITQFERMARRRRTKQRPAVDNLRDQKPDRRPPAREDAITEP